ncbi:MAG: type II toxin-antitoxin system prevent-host-death family antitoxin [Nitrosomonadales bacterium]|nr:type II toxin-antitoxin system prevent-host-death family antitoxin [Nitrosomonadales bacterium]
MSAVNLAVAKAQLSELINKVEAGEEVVITRHGRPVARVVPAVPLKQPVPLKRLAELRKQLPARKGSSAQALRELRDAE